MRSRRLEHDELVQARYSLASLERRRDNVRADWLSWKRVADRLEQASETAGRASRGFVSLAASPRGSVSLAGNTRKLHDALRTRAAGGSYLTRALGAR